MELEQLIAEVAGDDTELAGVLRERLGKNQTAAKRLSDGYLRQADYTTKTQALADEKKRVADATKQYEDALSAAEAEKDTILKELSKQRMSTSQADALLKAVQEKYGLKDEDIPGMADLIATRKTGKPHDSTPEFDPKKFREDFKAEMMKEVTDTLSKTLIPELSGMAALDVVWDDINFEHQQIFGKRLGRQEKLDLIKEAREKGQSIESTWDAKFNVGAKRAEIHDKSVADAAVADYEKRQADKRTADAMSGIKERPWTPSRDASSPLLKKDFSKGHFSGQQPEESNPAPAPAYRDAEGRAERLFETFQRRRSSGLGLGQPEPERKTA